MRASYLFAVLLLLFAPALARAEVGPCHSADICVGGLIDHGDAARFAALARRYPAGTLVWLSGDGGYIVEALDIGDVIHQRRFSTAVSIRNGYCASACALLFLSGRHAVIERNSQLLFHQGRDASRNAPPSEEVEAFMVERIARWGVTKQQAWALLHAAPNSTARAGTEAWARQLGFQFQIIPAFLGMWRNCASKFCVAV